MIIDIAQYPITFCTIEKPVYVADGSLYDRTGILHWINDQGKYPTTREPLAVENLRPDPTGRKTIEAIKKSKIERDHLE